ncbi:MAG: DUF996 domain-containing protein [Sulfolobales archaeon]
MVSSQSLPASSSKLSQAKILGIIGSLLPFIGVFIPYAGLVLGLVGLVLILLALKYISDEVGEPRIFNYAIYSVVAGVVGYVVLVFFVVGVFLSGFLMRSLHRELPPISIPTYTWPYHALESLDLVGLIISIIAFLVLAWIVMIISTYFLRKSYSLVADRLGVELFRTVGLLYFIGAILLIVLVGGILILVALILQIIAFISLPESPPFKPQPA